MYCYWVSTSKAELQVEYPHLSNRQKAAKIGHPSPKQQNVRNDPLALFQALPSGPIVAIGLSNSKQRKTTFQRGSWEDWMSSKEDQRLILILRIITLEPKQVQTPQFSY